MTLTKRVDRGSYHSYKLDGKPVSGVTTIIGDGIPKPALINWAAREVATYAADNLDAIATLDREARIDLLKGSHYRERDAAARRGTEVHGLGERLVKGEEVEVPSELAGHVDSYVRFLDEWQPEPDLVEAVVGNRTHRWMGTFDLGCTIGRTRWLLDIKTTRSGIFGETALQLAAYNHAEFWLDAAGDEQPWVPYERCAAIWVRADGYDLVPVVADDTVYRTFRYAKEIAEWQKNTSKTVIGDSLRPPTDGEAA